MPAAFSSRWQFPCCALQSCSFSPHGPAGKQVVLYRPTVYLSTEAWKDRRLVATRVDPDGVNKMLVQMVDKLDRPILHRTTDGNIVRHSQVLYELAQANSTGMRV